jgi:hypothetical protein
VRASLGVPRWFHAPTVDLPRVWPFGLFKAGLDEATFTTKYRARLWRQKPRILREVQELREAYGDLVLLCHEPAGKFCHRVVLGQWLAEQLGEGIEEVMPPTIRLARPCPLEPKEA